MMRSREMQFPCAQLRRCPSPFHAESFSAEDGMLQGKHFQGVRARNGADGSCSMGRVEFHKNPHFLSIISLAEMGFLLDFNEENSDSERAS